MAGTYDPVLKALVETIPEDWLSFLGLPNSPVSIIDADLSAPIFQLGSRQDACYSDDRLIV